MSEQSREQARAQMTSIRAMVAALECDFERLAEIRELLDEVESPEEAEELAKELAELEAQAGDCSDYDEAQRVILDDALSVEARCDWHSPGDDDCRPSEFRILLCTGGPHVQMVGELDDCGQPRRAWLEYSDWFESLQELPNQPGDQECLLTYASQFYFGE